MLRDKVLKGLEKIIGQERVKTEPADLVSYSYDAYLRAGVVATGCPACRMQLASKMRRLGAKVEIVHTFSF